MDRKWVIFLLYFWKYCVHCECNIVKGLFPKFLEWKVLNSFFLTSPPALEWSELSSSVVMPEWYMAGAAILAEWDKQTFGDKIRPGS